MCYLLLLLFYFSVVARVTCNLFFFFFAFYFLNQREIRDVVRSELFFSLVFIRIIARNAAMECHDYFSHLLLI